RTEAFLASTPVHRRQSLGSGRTVSVTDAIETGQVRGGFRGGDHVIRRDGVLGVRERDRDDPASRRFQSLDGCLPGGSYFRIETLSKIFLRDPQPQSARRYFQLLFIVLNGEIGRGRVQRIVPGDGA